MKMIFAKSIRNNRIVKGIYYFYRYYFGYSRRKFGFCADDVTLTPPLFFSNPKNVYLMGDNGLNNASIYTTNAKFIMKPHSGAAEGLKVSTGNHAMILGRFYRSITENEKPEGLDKDVVVESDVWIGRNVMILSGVIIGRGCTIAAGAVVTKSMPPYTVVAGVPAHPIKLKWTVDQILQHERALYSDSERFTREDLELIITKLKYQ